MIVLAAVLAASGTDNGERLALAITWVVGLVVAAGAVATALVAIVKALRMLGGWVKHSAVPWVKRAVRLVNTLSDLPQTLGDMQAQWDAHIKVADQKSDELADLNQKVGLILGEVKNNGGTSSKDSLHRIEEALGLPTPPYTPVPASTGPIPYPEAQEAP